MRAIVAAAGLFLTFGARAEDAPTEYQKLKENVINCVLVKSVVLDDKVSEARSVAMAAVQSCQVHLNGITRFMAAHGAAENGKSFEADLKSMLQETVTKQVLEQRMKRSN